MCGGVALESLIFSVPTRLPVMAGANETCTVHFAPAARLSPQSLLCEKSIPEMSTLTLRGTLAGLLIVIVFGGLVELTAAVPKSRLAGEIETAAAPSPMALATIFSWVPMPKQRAKQTARASHAFNGVS